MANLYSNLYDYNKNNIENKLICDGQTPGLMSKHDKIKLDSIKLSCVLIPGYDFNSVIYKFDTATSLEFTTTAIPSYEISTAILVSSDDSEVKVYAYLDGDIIKVAPEEDNTVIYANSDCSDMFYDGSNLTLLDLSNFDTSKVTDMSGMFSDCSNLSTLYLSNFDTSKVTDMSGMFSGCSSLTSASLDLSNFDTSKVTNMSGMFYGCSSLTSLYLSGFNTSKVTDMSGMFSGCSSLTSLDLYTLDISKVTDMSDMFYECSSLTSLDLYTLDTSKVTYMLGMFSGCSSLTSLDLSGFNTSNVISMRGMFADCSNLSTLYLSNFDTSKVTDMTDMFRGCSNLTLSITIMNPEISSYSSMFENCSTIAPAEFTVNYALGCQETAQAAVDTKSETSNVVLGEVQLTAAEEVILNKIASLQM